MTVSTALRSGEAQLITVSSTPRLDAQILLGYAKKVSKTQLMREMHTPLEADTLDTYQSLLDRRAQYEPIAYITENKQFYGYDFYVNNDALIPRPESESLIELTLRHVSVDANILEVGTGSGCIAITLKNRLPGADVHASDSSTRALDVARKNARIHQVSISFRHGDLLRPWDKNFDVIVANLPYLPNDMPTQPDLNYEPKSALLGGRDGLNLYRKFIPEALERIHPGGMIAIEHLPTQYESIDAICENSGAHAESFDRFVTKITANR